MITKWAKNVLLESVQDLIIPAVDNSQAGNKGFAAAKTVENNDVFINAFAYYHGYSFKASTSYNSDGIWVGTGNTPSTENDYFLESPVTSGCTGTTAKQSIYDATTNSIINRMIVTITNNTDSDLIISEIGKTCVFDTASTKGGSVNYGRKGVLIDRTILDSPITIPSGESGVIHYEFIYYTDTANRTVKAKGI